LYIGGIDGGCLVDSRMLRNEKRVYLDSNGRRHSTITINGGIEMNVTQYQMELQKLAQSDCGSTSCMFHGRGKGGMRVNGGCQCYQTYALELAYRESLLQNELTSLKKDYAELVEKIKDLSKWVINVDLDAPVDEKAVEDTKKMFNIRNPYSIPIPEVDDI
jgi:hypothetical protein